MNPTEEPDPDPIERAAGAIRHRAADLVRTILETLDASPRGLPLGQLLDELNLNDDQHRKPSTRRKTIDELRAFGAATIIRHRDRQATIRLTPLGRAWMNETLTDLPAFSLTLDDDGVSTRWTTRQEQT